jgi:hypothetical protein
VKLLLCLAISFATTAALLQASPAAAITADLAKKCDAAAYKAFPNQRVGTNLGTGDRNKYRQDCIAKNGDLSSLPTPAPNQPLAAPKAK